MEKKGVGRSCLAVERMWPLWNGGTDGNVKRKPLLEKGEDVVRQ
ncbi:hypothetical protein A2U01_0116130, partial [Trifolium medium]|nr:hypothetical protein [Trifolium medium]